MALLAAVFCHLSLKEQTTSRKSVPAKAGKEMLNEQLDVHGTGASKKVIIITEGPDDKLEG